MSQTSLPPGPSWPAPLQGVGFWSRPLAFLEHCRSRYGSRFTIRLPLAPPFVMLSDPDDIREVFTASPHVLHPGSGARILEPIVGTRSVILLDGQDHMEQRRLMLPAFHGERISKLESLVQETVDEELQSWPGDHEIELHERLQALTLEIILRAVFGLTPGPRMDALRDRLRAMLAFGDSPASLLVPPAGSRTQRWLERVGPFARFHQAREEADELLFALIDERRSEASGRDDVLAMLLQARHEADGAPMAREEVRDELLTLLVAGHETTASTLAWCADILAHRPDVVGRLREEDEAGAGEDYLTAVIHETLRCRPVLPNAAPRLVVEPIEVGGARYPTGVCLVPCTYLVHHDPDLYPDPYAFRPERFVGVKPGTYTWIPFGGGRRRCLGSTFAMLEMRIALRALLRGRDLMASAGEPELARRRNITIRPAGGCRLRLPERQRRPLAVAAEA